MHSFEHTRSMLGSTSVALCIGLGWNVWNEVGDYSRVAWSMDSQGRLYESEGGTNACHRVNFEGPLSAYRPGLASPSYLNSCLFAQNS